MWEKSAFRFSMPFIESIWQNKPAKIRKSYESLQSGFSQIPKSAIFNGSYSSRGVRSHAKTPLIRFDTFPCGFEGKTKQDYSRLRRNRTISASAKTNQKISKRSFLSGGSI